MSEGLEAIFFFLAAPFVWNRISIGKSTHAAFLLVGVYLQRSVPTFA